MPEFYDQSNCRYQRAVQPHLDAIAHGIRDNQAARDFILKNTEHEFSYVGAQPLWREQWTKRDPHNSLLCPFWSNYWYGPCETCDCRIDNSVSMEIDAMFFLRNMLGQTIALHVEMKRDHEKLSLGQAEAYRPRAACMQNERRVRKTLLPHDHFLTVIFCGKGTDTALVEQHFDRVISHSGAQRFFPKYPS